MVRLALRLFVLMAAALALVAVPTGAQAAAAPSIGGINSNQGLIYCQLPYLQTGYGPIAQCAQKSGNQARYGLYSPITGEFGPSTGWLTIAQNIVINKPNCQATDGHVGRCVTYPVVNTAFGGGARATQYQATRARWGWYNVVTGLFYPDTANGGWFPL